MVLSVVEVSETVCPLLYRSRLAEVTWEALSVVSLVFSSVRHVRRDVDKTGNRWIRPGFGNYSSSITVSHQTAGSILSSQQALRSSDICFTRGLRFMNDA